MGRSKLKEFLVQRLDEDNRVVASVRVTAKTWTEARALAVAFRPRWGLPAFDRALRCTPLEPSR